MRRVVATTLIISLCLAFIFLVVAPTPKIAAAPAWLGGYDYRRAINITAEPGAGVNYSIRLDVSYNGSIDLSAIWASATIVSDGANSNLGRNIISEGDYLYGVSNVGYTFAVFNISDIDSPTQLGSVVMNIAATNWRGIDLRKQSGVDYVFVAVVDLAGVNGGVVVMNVTDKANPAAIDFLDLGGRVHGMFLVGDVLYASGRDTHSMYTVDVSDPTSISVLDSIVGNTTYFHGCHDFYVVGNYCYAVNGEAGVGQYGVTVVNVTDTSNITVLGGTAPNTTFAGVTRDGNYLYVGAEAPGSGLTVVNITSATAPVVVGTYLVADNPGYWADWWNGYLVAVGGSKLHVVDVSDPSNPILLNQLDPFTENNRCTIVIDDRVFVSGTDDVSGTYCWKIKSWAISYALSLDGHCQGDFGDLRFTDNDGTTLLHYWPQGGSLVANTSVSVWVKVLDSLSSVNRTIYVYYGNATSTYEDSGDEVFPFFDDFPGVALNLTKWTVRQGAMTVSNGNLTLEGTGGVRGLIEQNSASYPGYATNVSVYARVIANNDTCAGNVFMGACEANDFANNRFMAYYTANSDRVALQTREDGAHSDYDADGSDVETWHIWDGKRIGASTSVTFHQDDVEIWQSTNNLSDGTMFPCAYEGNGVGDFVYMDWIFARKSILTEPSVLAIGTEESAPVGGSPTITTSAATNVLSTSARLNGNVAALGDTKITARGFVWDTVSRGDPGDVAPNATAYANNWSATGNWGLGTFGHTVSGLTANTTYYFRAAGENDNNHWDYGSELTFNTTVTPTPTPVTPSTEAEMIRTIAPVAAAVGLVVATFVKSSRGPRDFAVSAVVGVMAFFAIRAFIEALL